MTNTFRTRVVFYALTIAAETYDAEVAAHPELDAENPYRTAAGLVAGALTKEERVASKALLATAAAVEFEPLSYVMLVRGRGARKGVLVCTRGHSTEVAASSVPAVCPACLAAHAVERNGECKACGEPCDVGEDYCAGCDEDIALHVDWSADEGSVPWHVENVDAVA